MSEQHQQAMRNAVFIRGLGRMRNAYRLEHRVSRLGPWQSNACDRVALLLCYLQTGWGVYAFDVREKPAVFSAWQTMALVPERIFASPSIVMLSKFFPCACEGEPLHEFVVAKYSVGDHVRAEAEIAFERHDAKFIEEIPANVFFDCAPQEQRDAIARNRAEFDSLMAQGGLLYDTVTEIRAAASEAYGIRDAEHTPGGADINSEGAAHG
ncbi:hypothetical protein [Dokdonella fugitiva]|uniref:hypothetical protein n=1 Tax=Dokdonella fugitiva TaxID=328517 RepID=UPI001044E5E0|nr:hypothetical protein [Dokdonella fugitiva]